MRRQVHREGERSRERRGTDEREREGGGSRSSMRCVNEAHGMKVKQKEGTRKHRRMSGRGEKGRESKE